MIGEANNYQTLINKLNEFIRKYYKNQLIRGAIYSTALGLVCYLTIALTEYYGQFDTGARTLLFYTFLFAVTAVLAFFVIVPLLKLYRLGKTISHEQAGDIIGKHFIQVQDKLLNVLQLKKQNDETAYNASLLAASIDQKINELKPVPFTAAIDLSQNRKQLKYALIPIGVIAVILFASPSLLTESTRRLVKHNNYFEKQAPFQFVITNNKLVAIQQQDFELTVKLTGNEIPESVVIEIDDNEYKLDKNNTISFSYLFKNVQKSTSFRLVADGFKSRTYELQALPNPIILDFDITLTYPPYLGKKEETVKNTGDITIPVGTKVSWTFNTQNTSELNFSFNDTAFNLKPSSENNYRYVERMMKSRTYAITTANRFLRSKDSVTYTINVIPDEYPLLDIDEQKDSVSAKQIYFKGQAKDDYGFTKLTFNYNLVSHKDSGNTSQNAVKSEPVPIARNLTQDQFYYSWNLTPLPITPGDEIEYYFEVFDNDGVRGPKATRSQKKIYKAPTLRELADKAEQQNEEIKADLQKSIKDAKNIQKEIGELNKKMLEKNTLSWEEKKKLDELLNKQRDLQKKVESIRNENAIKNQQQQEYNPNNESLQEKQKQLEQLFDKVMTEDMKKKYEELQKLMNQLDKDKMQDALDKMKMDNKDLEKELDRSLEMFKQLEFQQKLEDVSKNLQDLSKKQDELSKESLEKNADKNALEKKQENLNKEFENVRKDMNELEKKNSELEKPNDLKNTDQQEQNIENDMKESSKSLEQNKQKPASKSQKSAAEKMQKMAEQLEQMQAEMEEQNSSEDINSLRQILDNLVQLSFDQESLMAKLEKVRTENPQFVKLVQVQKKLKDDAQIIEDSLLALSKRVFQLQSIINTEISGINNNMDKAIEQFVRAQSENNAQIRQMYIGQGTGKQQYAMTALNNLALLLSESLNNMQQQLKEQQSKSSGKGSCKKPGSTGQKPSFGSMKELQQQLNKQMEQMKKALEQGGKKDGQKGKGGMNGNEGMSEQLVKLAAQQEALRKMMQEMMQQQGGSNPGEMRNTMQQMEQTETDLVNKMITQETVKRQQEILTKMLDYEKAQKEREQDEKRESREGKNKNLSNLSGFLEYNKQKQKEAELLRTVPPALMPFYRQKVTEYFNNYKE